MIHPHLTSGVATSRAPEQDAPLQELFGAVASRFADRVAVTASDGQMTYRELDKQSTALAAWLVAAGTSVGSRVGVFTRRDTRLIVGILGTLKAGAAYVPIDPAYPNKRVIWTVEHSRASGVVTSSGMAEAFADSGVRAFDLDCVGNYRTASSATMPRGQETDVAYVIYTSGSTGEPKGVEVEHRSIVRLFDVTQPHFAFSEHDVWSLYHSAAFDFSVWEMWGALLFGGRVVVVPQKARSPQAFRELLRREGVTVLNQTPSAFARLAAVDVGAPDRLSALRVIIFGGERLDPVTLAPWMERYGDASPELVNMYGVTEATVHASYRRIARRDLTGGSLSPIGRPLADLRFRILREDGGLASIGEAGELCIEGPGLARGYLGRPDLTKQRFIDETTGDGRRRRYYRTGDRAVALGDGEYSYVGRLDDQLKIRGFRIEPGEIEMLLGREPGVAQLAVVAHKYGSAGPQLIAYVVPEVDADPELLRSLRHKAALVLPAHMRPTAYVKVLEMPLTGNGKVDKKNLPPPYGAENVMR